MLRRRVACRFPNIRASSRIRSGSRRYKRHLYRRSPPGQKSDSHPRTTYGSGAWWDAAESHAQENPCALLAIECQSERRHGRSETFVPCLASDAQESMAVRFELRHILLPAGQRACLRRLNVPLLSLSKQPNTLAGGGFRAEHVIHELDVSWSNRPFRNGWVQ